MPHGGVHVPAEEEGLGSVNARIGRARRRAAETFREAYISVTGRDFNLASLRDRPLLTAGGQLPGAQGAVAGAQGAVDFSGLQDLLTAKYRAQLILENFSGQELTAILDQTVKTVTSAEIAESARAEAALEEARLTLDDIGSNATTAAREKAESDLQIAQSAFAEAIKGADDGGPLISLAWVDQLLGGTASPTPSFEDRVDAASVVVRKTFSDLMEGRDEREAEAMWHRAIIDEYGSGRFGTDPEQDNLRQALWNRAPPTLVIDADDESFVVARRALIPEFRTSMQGRENDGPEVARLIWEHAVRSAHHDDLEMIDALIRSGPPVSPLVDPEVLKPAEAAYKILWAQHSRLFKTDPDGFAAIYNQQRRKLSPEGQRYIDDIFLVGGYIDPVTRPPSDGLSDIYIDVDTDPDGADGAPPTAAARFKTTVDEPPDTPPGGGGVRFIGEQRPGTGTNLMTEYQRLSAAIAARDMNLKEADFEWEKAKAQYKREREARLDRIAEEERQRAIAAETRQLRFDREETLVTAGIDRAELVNRATLQALPYLAPSSEFLPGQEPGGAMAKLSGFSGAAYTPVRTADVSVPFNPSQVADQAIADFEARSAELIEG